MKKIFVFGFLVLFERFCLSFSSSLMSINDDLNVFVRFDFLPGCVVTERFGFGIDDDYFSVAFTFEQQTFEMICDQLKVRGAVRMTTLILPIVITRNKKPIGSIERTEKEKRLKVSRLKSVGFGNSFFFPAK